MATTELFQENEVGNELFVMRTKESHDLIVKQILDSDSSGSKFGVKRACVLSESLQHFHPTSGFPPDLLHDLLEGIVPAELALCLKEMFRLKHFSYEYLNHKIT